jgi:hypothetical protein
MERYLQEQIQMTHRALVVAQSEQEIFRNQGKAILLEELLTLKTNINEFDKNK